MAADVKSALMQLIEPTIDVGGDDVEPPAARKKRVIGQMEGQLDVLAKRCQEGVAHFQRRGGAPKIDRMLAKLRKALEDQNMDVLAHGVEDEVFYGLQKIAYEAYQKDDFGAAEPMYTVLAVLRPAETTTYIILLTMLWKQQGADVAANAYETLEPILACPGFLYFGADCLANAGRPGKALEFLRKALEIIQQNEDPSEGERALKPDIESFIAELQKN
jgi:tetratricopeptide (TPR) repeat protein